MATKLPRIGGVSVLPNLPPFLAFTQGKVWHVKPASGNDAYSGSHPSGAFKTLAKALASATANQNDIVLLYAESNTSANTTDYQATQLNWNKDLVHLIGIGSGVSMSSRSRIAPASAYANAAPIMTVSANGCYFANLSIYMGVASVAPLGALSVTGARNRFDNCHILGMGATTNDVAGAYSLLLSGAEECEFHGCTIGSDRTPLGAAANSQIKFAATAKNILFKDCRIRLCSVHATNTLYVRAAAGSLDGTVVFQNCLCINSQSRTGSNLELTYGMAVTSDAGGDVIISPNSMVQAADVNASNAGNVYAATAASGISVPVTQ
jgi:hypothetical protein